MKKQGKQIRKWADEARSHAGELQVNYATHKVTEGELDNLTYLFMKSMGWGMRAADFAVLSSMTPNIKTIKDLNDRWIPQMVEYFWDHILGEPKDPAVEDLKYAAEAVRDMLYSMDKKTRNDTQYK